MGRLLVKTVVIITLLAILTHCIQPALSLTATVSFDKDVFNPLTESVMINYDLNTWPYPSANSATMYITDISHLVVWTYDPGISSGSVYWNGRDSHGNRVPNGQYTIYYTVIAPGIDGPDTQTSQDSVTVYVPPPTPTAMPPPPADTMPPVTTCTLSGTPGVSPYTSAVIITLTATDPAPSTGIKYTNYSLDGGIWQTYHGPITVSSNGNHHIEYRSMDWANHQEAVRSKNFIIQITVTPEPTLPKADFSADPTSGDKPLTVHFYDHSTGTSLTYTWYFGDGTSNEQNPTHVYQNAGTYDVSLRVTNALGTDQKIIPKYITVTEPGQNGGGGGQQNNGGGQDIQVPLLLYAWATPSTVDKDKDTIITVEVKDQNNTSVQDAKVNFTVPEGATLIPTSGITNESGICQFSFKSPGYGNYTLNATASKQGYASGFNQTMVIVGGNDLSCLLTILPVVFIIALIILLLLAAFFLLLRKTNVRLEPRRTVVPADGKTTIPVTVSLVNGLGRSKKIKKDMEVAMGTTAGTINDVTIPAGSSSVGAVLTSSKEFGPVVITANNGNNTATANVDFKYNQATLDVNAVPREIPADGTSTATVTIRVKNEAGDYIAPLEEKIVELYTTLGRIQSPVRLPPKSQSLSAMLTAGETHGEAVITALMGNIKGEGKVTLKGILKRFCMHCGSTMTMEASKCPKCGLTPPSGVDVKQCTTCGVVIPESARYCDKCGARQPERAGSKG